MCRGVQCAGRARCHPHQPPTHPPHPHRATCACRQALFNALRYHAHVNGASIIAVSRKDKTQGNFLRGILNHYAFGNPFKSTTILESSKAICVPAGADSLAAIGLPGGVDSQEAYERMSPQQKADVRVCCFCCLVVLFLWLWVLLLLLLLSSPSSSSLLFLPSAVPWRG